MNSPVTRVLVVDDNEQARDALIELLRFQDIEVVGESTFGAAAFTWADQLDVDVVLVSVEEPVARSLRTVESLSSGIKSWPVVGISSQGDRETMRKAMISGVRDFLVKPLNAEELHGTIINIHRVDQARRAVVVSGESSRPLGTIITIAGFKGGIGKSTVASNVAVSLAQQTQQHVVLTDLDLQFGDAAVMLDLVPGNTIEQMANDIDRMDPQSVQGYLTMHASRLKVLAAPSTPEAAEELGEEKIGQVLEMLASTNDFVVVDTAPHLDELSATAMDLSTIVLVVVVPEVPCIRRTKAALTLMQKWGYSRDKVKLVVNRSQKKGEISISEIEQALDYPVYAQIPEDPTVAKSISMGTPVAMFDPKGKAGRAANDLTRSMTGLPKPLRTGLLRRPSKAQSQSRQRWATSSGNSMPTDQSWLNGGGYDPFAPTDAPNGDLEEAPMPAGSAWGFEWPQSTGYAEASPSGNGIHANGNGHRNGESVLTADHGPLGPWLASRVREE